MIRYITDAVKGVFERNKYLEKHDKNSSFSNQLILQIIIAVSFFILSIDNVIAKSYYMLAFTLAGCVINGVSAFIAGKYHKKKICTYSTIISCWALFSFFVIYGGNDGFACLWTSLFPIMGIIVMDFTAGLISSLLMQVFLMIVLWTPVKEILLYQYGEQFCLRFPLFFLVAFMMTIALAISLQKSQYNERKHMMEIKEMTRIDPLTTLANRRCAYDEFKQNFHDDNQVHCVVMGDIDSFKTINDTYGHEFGDEVLIEVAKYMKEVLPKEYLKSRWGGEEFLFAANDSMQNVFKKIELLRLTISNHEFIHNNEKVNVTMTFGIAEYYHSNALNEAINIADGRMYVGKKATKNCTVIQ